jgi:hypothetical protein
MRIYDRKNDRALNSIYIFLTSKEVNQAIGYLESLLQDTGTGRHNHLESENFTKEITFSLYDPTDLSGFDERSKRLILYDK